MIVLMCINSMCDANDCYIVQFYEMFECFNSENIIKILSDKIQNIN